MVAMFSPKRQVSERYKLNTSRFSLHMKIIELVGKNKKVLDVGCATGYLAREFKKNGCYVMGIEVDEDAAEIARHHCDGVLTGDLEGMKVLPCPDGFFDIMVYADVLEHLKRPDVVLSRFKRYLSKDGFLIASIPNVAYLPTRLNLLFGRFEYQETGILDYTHLRFFTLYSIKRMLYECGYKILKIDYTGPAKWLRIFPGLLAKQFITVAHKQ